MARTTPQKLRSMARPARKMQGDEAIAITLLIYMLSSRRHAVDAHRVGGRYEFQRLFDLELIARDTSTKGQPYELTPKGEMLALHSARQALVSLLKTINASPCVVTCTSRVTAIDPVDDERTASIPTSEVFYLLEDLVAMQHAGCTRLDTDMLISVCLMHDIRSRYCVIGSGMAGMSRAIGTAAGGSLENVRRGS